MTLRHGLLRRIAEEVLAGCACLDPSAAILLVDPGSEPDVPRPRRERWDAPWIVLVGSPRPGDRAPSDAAPASAPGTAAR